ncbi:hypothetical protein [Caballeronia sp. NCTM5]|uniref:hypothetical protein n=1 Tax=Caballeronia sp. NCTM5 TaxID=2921755 RepID=UPI002027764C|nr:hypothetical protein [Caballeronia sp. NCTM5]
MKALRAKLARLEAARAARGVSAPTIDAQTAEALQNELLAAAVVWFDAGIVETPAPLAQRVTEIADSGALDRLLRRVTLDELDAIDHLLACCDLRDAPMTWRELRDLLRDEYARQRAVNPAGIPDAACRSYAAHAIKKASNCEITARMVDIAAA